MSKPIIVLTSGRRNLSTASQAAQDVWTGCNINYVSSVLRSGGVPMLMPYLDDMDSIHATLKTADGIIFTGGGDVISLNYGEEPHIKSHYQDPIRDEMELAAAKAAIEMGIPILGICRGIQVLNVALGGTLVQDIASQIPNSSRHFSGALAPVLLHNIDVEKDTLLAKVLGSTSLAVNSWHHQAVKDLGKGLKINCRARDGVIEGIESSEGQPILALQCHPEEIAVDYPIFQKLFDWLVEEASK